MVWFDRHFKMPPISPDFDSRTTGLLVHGAGAIKLGPRAERNGIGRRMIDGAWMNTSCERLWRAADKMRWAQANHFGALKTRAPRVST